MPILNFADQNYDVESGESVLACLERNNVAFPSSCKSGTCQSCLAQLTSGTMENDWQAGLKETYRAQNYFLPCIAKPSQDISIQLPDANDISSIGIIKEVLNLTSNAIALRLSVDNLQNWTPGQYLNLINSEDSIRSYSIANLPETDGFIELHIKLYSDGLMSQWLKAHAKPGCKVLLRGPAGECFYYNPTHEKFNMVLAGTGTGLAPLLAIVRAALISGHQGQITLLHGGVTNEDLYYKDVLSDLDFKHQNFSYLSCVLRGDGTVPEASIDSELKKQLVDVKDTKAYICGPEETAKKLKMVAFLAGVASKNIFSDLFITSK